MTAGTSDQAIVELKPVEVVVLQPMLTAGELVADDWWELSPAAPVSPWRRNLLFFFTILLPVTAGSVYFGFLTGDRYVSEAHFLVRTSLHDDIGNLASLMQNQKLSRAADETYAITDYMTSRDAFSLARRGGFLKKLLGRPEAGPFERYPSPFFLNNEELLYRRFKGLVDAKIDSESGIGTLSATAFQASDAQNLAKMMLSGGEQLVNQLNARAHDDSLAYTEADVRAAKDRLTHIEDQLSRFRNQNRLIAPDKEASLTLQSMTVMRTKLAELKANLRQKTSITPRSPTLTPLREEVRALEDEITRTRKSVAGTSTSMAGKLGEYEKLVLDRSLAVKTVEAATTMLSSAERDARQQQLYVETIVEPSLPDQARYPYRLLAIVIVIIGAFTLRWFVSALGRTVLEHQS